MQLYDVFKTWEKVGRIKTNDIHACIKNRLLRSDVDRANLITFSRDNKTIYTLSKAWG